MRPYASVAFAAVLLSLAPASETAAQVAPPSAPVRVISPTELPRTNFPRLRRSFDGDDHLQTTNLDSWLTHLEEMGVQLQDAQAAGNTEAGEELLAEAMNELAFLVRQPEARADARFAAVYSDIVASYEEFYGEALAEESFYDEVFAARDELTALLGELENPLGEGHLEVTPIVATVPMTINRTVTSTMEWLQSKPNTLKNWLTRAHTYFPMIEKIFAEEGVPDELKYLAMIESGLRPAVKSRARAVGMWQFMSATGSAYGLKIDRYVDERMDPEKATRAAARHLRDLYQQYGNDWHVALAGYNCSPRCIKRAIASARSKGYETPTYWDMYEYLPKETRGYVPQFIATALMLSNPSAYSVSTDEVAPVYEYEIVPVRSALSLERAAALAGTEKSTLEFLNPSLYNGAVPKTRDAFPLRLPVGTSAKFLEAYATAPAEVLVDAGEYVVRKGDTLGRIAARFDTSVSELKRDNGLRSDRLNVGQVLQVPGAGEPVSTPGPAITAATAAPAVSTAQPVLVRYGTLELRPVAPSEPFEGDSVVRNPGTPRIPVVSASLRTVTAPAEPSSNDSNPVSNGSTPSVEPAVNSVEPVASSAVVATPPAREARTVVTYRIRRGDTLTEIAKKYDVSVADVREWNSLSGSRIRAGASIKLFLGQAPAATPLATSPAANSASKETGSEAAPVKVTPTEAVAESVSYRVKRGDTLFDIARAHHVTVEQLRTWNDLRGSSIRSGQRLKIYSGSTGTQVRTHRVVRGDNLTDIARRYGVTVEQIKAWNSLSSSRINPGDELRIAK